MNFDDTAIGGPRGQFPTTHVSLLEAASTGLANQALERVAALYWKPVYHFLRLKFRLDNEDAKDLTQGFFAAAIERDFLAKFDPARASFRTYLRMAAERFAANRFESDHRLKRGGDAVFVPVEGQDAAGESPDAVFEREWRRRLFVLALQDLRECAAREGKQIPLAVFEAYDLAEGVRPSYAELAARFAIPATSVTNYLAWARRMLREFVGERLRGVTGGERELRQELRRLWT